MTKPKKWHVCHAKSHIPIVLSQFFLPTFAVCLKGSRGTKLNPCSDWADVHADLSLY